MKLQLKMSASKHTSDAGCLRASTHTHTHTENHGFGVVRFGEKQWL
jgi:hypothetical protein